MLYTPNYVFHHLFKYFVIIVIKTLKRLYLSVDRVITKFEKLVINFVIFAITSDNKLFDFVIKIKTLLSLSLVEIRVIRRFSYEASSSTVARFKSDKSLRFPSFYTLHCTVDFHLSLTVEVLCFS